MARAEKRQQASSPKNARPAPRARVDGSPLLADQKLLDSIQSEVSLENRPLLQFITANAKYLIGIIVLFILVLVGTGIYGHVQKTRQEETTDALAKVMARPADEGRIEALEALRKDAPGFMKTAVDVDLAAAAGAAGDSARAAESYGRVAADQKGTPVGVVAGLDQAGSLLAAGRYAEGAKILQDLLPTLQPQAAVQPKTMLAEAAARAKDYDLAARTYEDLAASAGTDIDREYCATRAKDLRAAAEAEKADAQAEKADAQAQEPGK